MIVAAIDIGSNTSLLLIARLSEDLSSSPSILEDQLFFTRLAEGFSKKKEMSADSLKRQRSFFEKASRLIDQYSVKKIKCVATAAARKAENAHQLLSCGRQYGFSIDIISAEEEAKLSRKGALFKEVFNARLIERLQSIVRFIKSEDYSYRLPALKEYLQLLDNRRNTSFHEVFPELNDMFKVKGG